MDPRILTPTLQLAPPRFSDLVTSLNRVKMSENLAATAVVNVAPVIIALTLVLAQLKFMVASL